MSRIPIDRRVWKGAAIFFGLTILFFFLWLPVSYFFLFLLAAHIAFFRDPERKIPAVGGPVSPADGQVVEISAHHEDRYLREEAVKIGIFLSIFDCHINRAPIKGEVQYLDYRPGKFLNVLNHCSAVQNESNWIGIADGDKKSVVRQIAGIIARRICCDVKIGSRLERGEKLGMICYGSRTEFLIPKRFFRPTVRIGEKVKAGETLLGEWQS